MARHEREKKEPTSIMPTPPPSLWRERKRDAKVAAAVSHEPSVARGRQAVPRAVREGGDGRLAARRGAWRGAAAGGQCVRACTVFPAGF